MIIGDMSIKDLTPKTTNLGDRLVKNFRICGTGIYTYHKSEIPLLNIGDIPEEYKDKEFFNVYRPENVLVANKDKFARIPIITGKHILVDRNNAKQLAVGMIGDTVNAEKAEDGETYLYTTGTIIAGDGVQAYEDYGQLSVGYDPIMKWSKGTHKGVDYQIELEGFNDVNHVLICKVARGGKQCAIVDSTDGLTSLQRFIIEHKNGGNKVNLFTKIFGNKKKEVAGDSVTLLLDSIAIGADPEQTVSKIREIAGDSIKKDSDMDGFLSELAMAKNADSKELGEAVGIVKDAWKALAGDSDTAKDSDTVKDEEVGDEHPEDCDCEECKAKRDSSKDTAGDSISIDYEKLANMVAEKMQPKAPTQPMDIPSPQITGDTVTNTVTSDSIMNEIYGGK